MNRARHLWPKELQLITRLTDLQVKRLVSKYRAGDVSTKIETYDETFVYHSDLKVDRKLPSAQPGFKMSAFNPGIISPGPNSIAHNPVSVRDLSSDDHSSQEAPKANLVITSVGPSTINNNSSIKKSLTSSINRPGTSMSTKQFDRNMSSSKLSKFAPFKSAHKKTITALPQ